MKLLTRNAVLKCPHGTGIVGIVATQSFVFIDHNEVLVEVDPEQRPIVGCTNANPPQGINPCTLTLRVEKGYSDLIRIDGKRVCLETVTGKTTGTPPGTFDYSVSNPGQDFVAEGQ